MRTTIVYIGFIMVLLLMGGCTKPKERVLVDFVKCNTDADCVYIDNIQRNIPGCVNLEVFRQGWGKDMADYKVDPSISCSCLESDVTEGEGILNTTKQKVCEES